MALFYAWGLLYLYYMEMLFSNGICNCFYKSYFYENNKTNSNRVSHKRRTVKRRSAGRSPESTVSKYSNDSENDIVAQIEKAVAQGDYETQKRLVEQYYGIQIG